MSSPRIEFRNHIVGLIKQIADFNDGNVSLYKLDRVDSTPCASVYLGRLTSETEAMGGSSNRIERDLTVMVDFHSNDGTDADAQTDAWLVELEQLIFSSSKNGELPAGCDDAELSFAEFRPTDTSKERRGDLVTVWRVEISETLTAS